ncbi:flippase [Methanotorris igneus]|uniref:Polysaccharide biosynthesis protein n=1 Tax=Methanotorris igneus (strain DSM 5666 / JCM 11834 / Kol 5) TaxID=880724 RepID=F6BAX7_METIK|nr:flippase [Methanotorris igneus]AEF97064.1 polysaccharide biosynthesis protein [Methanotorris igneus Kol 5]
MGVAKRIAKNTGILFVSNIISKFFGFVYTVYMARYLGAEGFGILSFALAFTGMFGIIADFGLQPLTVREVARNPELTGKYLGNIAVIKSILGIITFILIVLTINLMNYPAETVYVVYLVAFYVLIGSFNNMFYSIYQAHEKMEYVGIGNILNSSLMLLGVFTAMYLGFNVEGFAYIYLISGIGVLLYNICVTLWKFVKPKIEIDLKFWKELLKEAWPFALSGFFITVYYWIDSVMLSYMVGNLVVGWYNAAYRIILVFLFIPIIVNAAIYPIMSRYYITSNKSLKIICEKYFKIMLTIGLPLGILITVFAEEVVLSIFGQDYHGTIIALKILIWGLVSIFANAPFVKLFESINRQSLVTKVTGFAMVMNIILNILLIPKFSYIGASITTLVTEFTIAVFVIILGIKLKYVEFANILNILIRLTVCGIFMFVYLKISVLFLGTIISAISSLIVYSLLLYIMVLDKDDKKILKNLFNKKKRWILC